MTLTEPFCNPTLPIWTETTLWTGALHNFLSITRTQFTYYNGSVYRNDPSGAPPTLPLPHRSPHLSLSTQRSLLLLSTNKAAFQRCNCDGRCNIAEILWWIIINWIKGTKFVLGEASCGCKVSTCRYNFQ